MSRVSVVSGVDRCEAVDEPVRLGRRPALPDVWAGRGRMIVVGAADPAVSRNALDLRIAGDGWELHNPSASSPLSLVAQTTGELQIAPGTGLRLVAGASIVLIPGVFGPYRVMLDHHVGTVDHAGTHAGADTHGNDDGGGTTLGFTPPDPVLRLWLAARFGSYVKPDIDRPSARPAQASYPVFSAACGTAASLKGLMRREEKLREALDQIIGGVAGRENTHRFANELVQRGLLTAVDLETLHGLLDRKGNTAEGG